MVGGVCCGCLFGDRQFNLTTVSVRMRSRPAPLLLRRPSSTRPEAHGLWGLLEPFTEQMKEALLGSSQRFGPSFSPRWAWSARRSFRTLTMRYRAFVAVLTADIQQDAIERALAAWLRPGSGRQCPMSVTAIFPQIIWPQSRATDRRHLRLVLSAPRPIPAFPTPLRRVIGHHHWPWYRLARANRFSGSRRPPLTTEAPTKATGATLMRIDLKKVNVEITGLRSKLAAIDNDLDECRRRHFEHPLGVVTNTTGAHL